MPDQMPNLSKIPGLHSALTENIHTYSAFTEMIVESYLPGSSYYQPLAYDKVNTFNVNSMGYRSPEFSENNKLVTLGCSHTFGCGVPENGMWPKLLADHLGLDSYSNLGTIGDSTQRSVYTFMAYVEKYGKPEYAALLMPEYTRMVVAIRNDVNTIHGHFGDGLGVSSIVFNDAGEGDPEYPKFSKRPYDITEILNYEALFYATMAALNTFIYFCRSNGIKFVYGTWNSTVEQILEEKSKLYPNFSSMDMKEYAYVGIDPTRRNQKDCHSELAKNYRSDNWIEGLDRDEQGHGAHIGIHDHVHVAEAFAKALHSIK